jgi:hypothetical protein
MSILRGACRCGAVEYTVEDSFKAAFNCHCSLCRKTSGSAFKAVAAIAFDKVRITKGETNLRYFGDPKGLHDKSCGECGSVLYSIIPGNGNAHIAMGTLVDVPSIRPQFHIYVGSKAPWFEITDDLPQFDELPA